MADKKISQLTAASVPLSGTEELPIVQGGQTLKATAQDIANLAGSGGVKKYVALLSPGADPSTDAPVSNVLENTLGSDITWFRGNFAGSYYGENVNLVNPSKVFITMTGNYSGEGNGNVPNVSGEIYNDGSGFKFWFYTGYWEGNGVETWGSPNAPIFLEIRVYP